MLYNPSLLIFLSTLSLRRATKRRHKNTSFHKLFLSTLSLRRATTVTARIIDPTFDFYPRSPCGERRDGNMSIIYPIHISIHALLAESDRSRALAEMESSDFYPRSPCGERPYGRINDISRLIFLSTLSLRRATVKSFLRNGFFLISIHALLAESDRSASLTPTQAKKFLSTLSLRRATAHFASQIHSVGISIHALLAESDVTGFDSGTMVPAISIHALLAESDDTSMPPTFIFAAFLSTLSLRRATLDINRTAKTIIFLSTLSLRRATV